MYIDMSLTFNRHYLDLLKNQFEIEETDSIRVRNEKETRKGILEFILGQEGNAATIQNIINHMNMSRHTIEKYIAFLVGANLINTVGTAYFITEEGKAQIPPKKSQKDKPSKEDRE